MAEGGYNVLCTLGGANLNSGIRSTSAKFAFLLLISFTFATEKNRHRVIYFWSYRFGRLTAV